MLEQMKQADENSFEKFSNGGRLSKTLKGSIQKGYCFAMEGQ
jgi:hypothetical protein